MYCVNQITQSAKAKLSRICQFFVSFGLFAKVSFSILQNFITLLYVLNFAVTEAFVCFCAGELCQ